MASECQNDAHAVGRAALGLAIFTVTYNLLEGAVSIAFSIRDESTALLGFGADSFIESLSGAVMIWRFWRTADSEQRERRALHLVGVTFVVLAAYVAWRAIAAFLGHDQPDRSLAALVIAAVSLVVMPALFLWKQRTARKLGSRSLRADSHQTLACMLLSAALLVGAGLNYWAGIWQADPVAALAIAGYLAWEGWEALTAREAGD